MTFIALTALPISGHLILRRNSESTVLYIGDATTSRSDVKSAADACAVNIVGAHAHEAVGYNLGVEVYGG